MKKTQVAKRIEKYLFKYELDSEVRIYFNNKCWDISMDKNGKINREVIENIKASDYGEYMNDDVISGDFSSDTILWEQMNYGRYEFDMEELGRYHNRNWQLVNALDTFMEENGLARENGTSTDFIIINEEDL